jgi:uncharacterized protein YjiS (DUF1127 family)
MRRVVSFITPTLLEPLAPSPAADTPPRVHADVAAWAIRAAASNGFGGELPSSGDYATGRHAVSPTAFVDRGDPGSSAVARARRYARRVVALYRLLQRRARHKAELRQLQSLDAAALRDLGLTRSEIGSAHAEAVGRVAPTRRIFVEHEWFRSRAGVPAGPGTAF